MLYITFLFYHDALIDMHTYYILLQLSTKRLDFVGVLISSLLPNIFSILMVIVCYFVMDSISQTRREIICTIVLFFLYSIGGTSELYYSVKG